VAVVGDRDAGRPADVPSADHQPLGGYRHRDVQGLRVERVGHMRGVCLDGRPARELAEMITVGLHGHAIHVDQRGGRPGSTLSTPTVYGVSHPGVPEPLG
jgi:hypothetical protein